MNASLGEEMTAVFTDNIQLGVRMFLQHLFSLLEDILVIRACKSLIRRDDQTAEGTIQRVGVMVDGIEERAFHVPYRTENTLDFRSQCVEVGAYTIQVGTRLTQLGRRNQVHRVGNLFGILDAFDMGFDFFCAGHYQSPHFSAAFTVSR